MKTGRRYPKYGEIAHFIRDIILEQELMLNDYYLQNRTFTKDRDIECANEMVVGKDVLPIADFPFTGRKYLYDYPLYSSAGLNTSETEKTLPNGDVIVNSGVTLKLEATNSIQFKPGFRARSGAELLVQVDGTNPTLRSMGFDYMPCGRIEKSSSNTYVVSSPHGTSVSWHLKGLNLDVWQSGETFTLPDNIKKGQYSLSAETAECHISSIVIEAYGQVRPETDSPLIISKSEYSLKIVPNPASESIRLVTSKEIASAVISSTMGQSIATFNLIDQPTNEIDINGLSSGVYNILITYKNGEIEVHRFTKSH